MAVLATVAVAVAGCASPSSPSPAASLSFPPSAAVGSSLAASSSPQLTGSASATAGSSAASAASSHATPASSSATAAPSHGFAHVYIVVMENREYDAVVGSPDAPYLNGLFATFGLVTGMHAETHPSEPNYIALVSGDTRGVRDDGVYNLDAPNLFDQAAAAGRTWRVYAQGYPGDCSGAASTGYVSDGPGQAGQYARKHNPAISFTSISGNPARCARITGLAGFDPAAADLEFIVPNQTNDMHSASTATGDAFLRSFLPSILDSAAFAAGSLLVVTWDEGGSNDGGGGHIATLVATPGMRPGARLGGDTSHYSILRTVEDAWGMTRLGGAVDAVPLAVSP